MLSGSCRVPWTIEWNKSWRWPWIVEPVKWRVVPLLAKTIDCGGGGSSRRHDDGCDNNQSNLPIPFLHTWNQISRIVIDPWRMLLPYRCEDIDGRRGDDDGGGRFDRHHHDCHHGLLHSERRNVLDDSSHCHTTRGCPVVQTKWPWYGTGSGGGVWRRRRMRMTCLSRWEGIVFDY